VSVQIQNKIDDLEIRRKQAEKELEELIQSHPDLVALRYKIEELSEKQGVLQHSLAILMEPGEEGNTIILDRLPFDLYERVHLEGDARFDYDSQVSITERTRVELDEDRFLLRGQLKAVFRSSKGELIYEHTIPVEISIPFDRVRGHDPSSIIISTRIDGINCDFASDRVVTLTGKLNAIITKKVLTA
jgi:hypothetical protein